MQNSREEIIRFEFLKNEGVCSCLRVNNLI